VFSHLVVFSDKRYSVVRVSSKLATTVMVAKKKEPVKRRKFEVDRKMVEATDTFIELGQAYKDFRAVILEESCFVEATTRFLLVE